MLSLDLLINLGIEAAGFLAGGGLLIVLFPRLGLVTLGQAKRRLAVATTPPSSVTPNPEPVASPVAVATTKMEFVPLAASRPATVGTVPSAETSQYRRNRREVIDMARQMLAAGSSREQIQRAVPLSEGELALLAGN